MVIIYKHEGIQVKIILSVLWSVKSVIVYCHQILVICLRNKSERNEGGQKLEINIFNSD